MWDLARMIPHTHFTSTNMAKQYIFNFFTFDEHDGDGQDIQMDQPSNSQPSNSITNDELSYIASKMSSDNMTKFADKFLNIKHNQWGYNYALLKHWGKYASENAKQVSLL